MSLPPIPCAKRGCGRLVRRRSQRERWCCKRHGQAGRRHQRVEAARTQAPILTCKNPKCGKSFSRRRVDQKNCSRACSQNHGHYYPRSKREARRASKAERHPATALIHALRAEMDADYKSGLCIYCERRLRPGQVYTCGDKECLRLYNNDYRRQQRAIERQAREAVT